MQAHAFALWWQVRQVSLGWIHRRRDFGASGDARGTPTRTRECARSRAIGSRGLAIGEGATKEHRIVGGAWA
eukprot:3921553-Pleurochrysis_carterae.AAC.1